MRDDLLPIIILHLNKTYKSSCLDQIEQEASLMYDQKIREDIRSRIRGLSVVEIEAILEQLKSMKQAKKLEVKSSAKRDVK